MKICIAGLTGSGKTTLGDALAKELNIEHVKPTYKMHVKSDRELISMLKNITAKYVKDFDNDIIRNSKGKNCIITTWHGPWIIKDATLRVWLNAPEDERIRRIASSRKMSISQATKYIRAKDKLTLRQFKLAYKKDYDFSVIDITINHHKVSTKEAISIISMIALMRDKKSFE